MGITIGDWVEHATYSWHGKMKVISINFGTVELLNNLGNTLYYNVAGLVKVEAPSDTSQYRDSLGVEYSQKKEDPLYCTCSRSEAEIVNSSTQVQGSIEEKDRFKFCRTCKKEAK